MTARSVLATSIGSVVAAHQAHSLAASCGLNHCAMSPSDQYGLQYERSRPTGNQLDTRSRSLSTSLVVSRLQKWNDSRAWFPRSTAFGCMLSRATGK